MKNQKIKNFLIVTILLLLIITISLTAAYLYAGLTLEDQDLGAEFEELNSLNFSKSGDLSLNVNQLNAAEGAGNIFGDVTLSATYTGANVSKEKYNVYVNVLENDFVYSTDENYAEVILRVYNPDNVEITELDGLTYVEQNGNSGFDITTYIGLITIANFFEIELTDGINEVVQNWKIEIEFVNLDTNQNENSGKTLVTEVSANVDEEIGNIPTSDKPDICSGESTYAEGTFQHSIIENAGGVNCEEPDFSIIASTNDGIFQTNDVYGPTYYYRGEVENNWVKFAGFYWKIVRINGDGSVKLIFSDENSLTELDDGLTSDNKLYTHASFNVSFSAPEYVGYTYELGSLNNPSVKSSGDSTIKGVVDTWYDTNIENQGLSSYVTDTAYCADRTSYSNKTGLSVNSSYTTDEQYFNGYVDLKTNKTPTLLCNEKKDYYTVEDTEIGNGVLKYPVSLITANEVAYAGGVFIKKNDNYYLYTGEIFWTFSPSDFDGTYAYGTYVTEYGYLSYAFVTHAFGVRPTLSLSSSVLTTGNGKKNSPYEVKMS